MEKNTTQAISTPENDYNALLAELEATRKKLNTLEAVLDNIPFPVFSKDDEGALFFVNKAYEQFFQVNREDVLHKTIKQLNYFIKEEQERYHQDAITAANEFCNISCERVYHVNQADISTLFSCEGFSIPQSEEKGCVGIIVDITKQKKLEKELIQKNYELGQAQEKTLIAQERIQLILDTMPLCAVIWSIDGKVQDVNTEFLRLFEFEDKKNIEQNVYNISPIYQPCGTKSVKRAHEHIRDTIKTGQKKFEWVHQKNDGELVPSDVTLIHRKYRGEDIIIAYTQDLRELRASQKEAAESAEYVQIMLDTISLGANIWNSKYENLASNKAAAELFDLASPEEYLEKFYQLSPPFQADGKASNISAREKIQQAFQEGRCQFEWMHQKLNGEPVPCEITLIRKKYRGEDIVVGYTQDLRELKASQKEAAESAEYVQIMLDTISLGANIWNSKYENLASNKAAADLFDLASPEEYLEKFYQLSPPFQADGKDSSISAREKIQQAFQEGRCQFEWMHQKLNGEPVPCEITLIRKKYRGEDIVVGYTRDLRELKASQKEAAEATEMHQVILNTMPIAVSFWNKEYELFDCNTEAIHLFGATSKEEVLENYTNLSAMVQPDGVSSNIKVQKVINEAFEKGHTTFEWLHQNIHGDPLPVEIMLIHTKYHGNDIAVSYMRDLREFKSMLEEVHSAREAAESSAKAKSDFLANMSHEIRTPMNGIIGLLRLLEGSTLDAVQINFVQKALFSATELLRIINDILDFSKIEAGKLDIEQIPFTLHEITSHMKNLLGNLAEKKSITLSIHEGEFASTPILGDPVRLKQVILNLLSNAIKFTSKGSVRLDIQGTIQDNELYCQFTVRDTGIGLKPEQISTLFSAFSQADNTITRRYGGTGLGLAISKNIIAMMQGDIWVESTFGQGSTFFCTAKFPLAIDSLQSYENGISYEHLETDKQVHNGHILLVEDNDINQLVAQETIQSMGYTLDIAQNGQEALDMLKEKTYDAVLMDIQMPIMDGYTATEKIRAQAAYAHLPIIAMSAHAMVGVKEKSIEHGMNDHITKPIDITILRQALRYWISVKR